MAALAVPGLTVPGPAAGQAVVQAVPGPEAEQLAEAMRMLAQRPEDLSALLQAGDAALYLGDLAAAQSFYARAREVAPQDGRVAAGHAVLLVRQDRPAEALEAFDVAQAAGANMAPYAADRGLAYDLVGNNAAAQVEYRRALTLGPDDTVTLRLAISQAIAGDRGGFEATLLPLLQQSDLAAFRMRAFALAINGQQDEAVSIAETMLPERLSSRLAPYLRYMPRLTRAQQAAAAHLGRFPQAHQIGHDDPAIARPARPAQAPAQQVAVAPAAAVQLPPSADARLVPSGATMGSQPASTPAFSISQAVVQPLPASEPVPAPLAQPPASGLILQQQPAPAPEPAFAAPTEELPPAGQPVPAPPPEPVVVAVAEPQAAPPAQAPAPAPEAAFVPAPAETPAPAPAITQAPAQLGMTEAFATFIQPAATPDPVAAGGVDITTIAPPRERPKPPPPPAPPPPPPVPSRHWVQVATGQDVAALGFDWRRIRRTAGDLLQDAKPHLAEWDGRTRLLAGPYSAPEAAALVTSLKEAGVDSFRFTSARGEDVRALD